MTYNPNDYKRGSMHYIVACMGDYEYKEDDNLPEEYDTTNEDRVAGMRYGVEQAPWVNKDTQGMISKWNEVVMDVPCTYKLDSQLDNNGAMRNPRAIENRPNERNEQTPTPQEHRGPS